MSLPVDLEELFQKWNDLNSKVGTSFGQFDFDSIKEIRKEQGKIEDSIYSVLVESAPDEIKKFLPEGCGELEIGFNVSEKKFYFS